MDQAVANDILWVNSAGNQADVSWFGSQSDPDRDRVLGFGGFNDEVMDMPLRACGSYVVQLRWDDDWSGASTDLDLHIYSKTTNRLVLSSNDIQSGENGHVPWEAIGFRSRSNSNDFGIVVVNNSRQAPEWIQVVAWTSDAIQHHTKNGSITNPAESANPGLLAVGAAPWYDVNTVESFSSRGPAPDGRTKPEIVGADCGATSLTPLKPNNRGFCGTSQSAPHVAGMAALVRQRFPEFSAQQVASYLKHRAEHRGVVPNNTWGYGFAKLPPQDAEEDTEPPMLPGIPENCVAAINSDGAINGEWSSGCQSQVTGRGLARYFTFTLAQQSQVTIDLESTGIDPYLYLRRGESTSGAFLTENNDVEPGVNTDSRIVATLAPGTYTVEATTYHSSQSGAFTLTVSGLAPQSTIDPGPGDGPTDPCGDTIGGEGAFNGEWESVCQSQVPGRGFARYFTFTLAQQSQVTIDLESITLDTYLYLRSGTARSGSFLHENDDVEPRVDTDSRIVATLAPGTYTIEATTYYSDLTGSFTLTISGLNSQSTTDPGTGGDTSDPCGDTIISDGAFNGEWSSGCRSQVTSRGFARYFTLNLDQRAQVTIDLESTLDTYLYLRRGSARSGAFIHENDDVEPRANTDSRIVATLPAGDYTIEATTYYSDQAAAFTLTISGLDAQSAARPQANKVKPRLSVDSQNNGRAYQPKVGKIVLSSSSGHSGTRVTVQGENFEPLTPLGSVTLGSVEIQLEEPTSTDRLGNLTFQIEIPSSVAGTQPIEVTVGQAVAIATITVTEPHPASNVEVAVGLKFLGDNLVVVWHFDNGTKTWAYYNGQEGSNLTFLIPDETYLIRVKLPVAVTLNGDLRALSCRHGNCWNALIW